MPSYYTAEIDWRRAARDAVITVLVAVLLAYAGKRISWLVDPEAEGRWFWLLLGAVALFALLASFAAQTGRRPLFYGAAVVVLILGLNLPSQLAAGAAAASKPPAGEESGSSTPEKGRPSPAGDLLPLTDEDRAELQPIERPYRADVSDWLCQWALGVSLGGIEEGSVSDPEAAARSASWYDKKVGAAGTVAWWSWKTSGTRVTLAVAKGGARDSETFLRFTQDLFESQIHADSYSTYEQSVRKIAPFEFKTASQDRDARWRHIRCVGALERSPEARAACVITDASAPVELEKVRDSLMVGDC